MLKIEISEFYSRNRSITEMAARIDEEIEYHERTYGEKPRKVIVAPVHEWESHKNTKYTAVISL